MSSYSAPLVDAERIRIPFLLAHIVTYAVGAAVLVPVTEVGRLELWMLLGGYLVFSAIGAVALWTRRTPIGFFLIVDAFTLGAVSVGVGQHPGSVQAAYLVIVLTALATLRFPVVLGVAGVSVVGAVAGLVIGAHEPWIGLSREQVQASETAAMIIGLAVGALAIVVLARLLRDSLDRQAEALVAEQRASALQQRFIAMVSHELRTPLTSIRGFAEVLDQEGGSIPIQEQQEFIEAIASQSAHLSRLVDDVLDVLRIQSGKLSIQSEVVGLHRVVDSALAMVSAPQGKRIERGPIVDVELTGDQDRLVQVLRNLMENGLKHGGDLVRVSAVEDDGMVALTVEDDGAGVPDGMKEAVFGEFVQVAAPAERAAAGFGLGLPIARRLVEAMGGRIWSQSSALGGAAFVVQFPSVSVAARILR